MGHDLLSNRLSLDHFSSASVFVACPTTYEIYCIKQTISTNYQISELDYEATLIIQEQLHLTGEEKI